MRSYAMGMAGVFAFMPKSDGGVCETPGGPSAVIRYTATMSGDNLDELATAS